MPEILAHRGNVGGPCPATENSVPAIAAALSHGWGIEIDIRRDAAGRFYIAHDALRDGGPPPTPADDVCVLLRRHPRATVALNIKERGYERALLAYLRTQRVLEQVFLFDMELIEPVAGASAAHFHALDRDVRLAARVSDRAEPAARALGIAAAGIIWLDEFDGAWATAGDVRLMKGAGRRVFAVSPELHGRSLEAARHRWEALVACGVDGICTDYPAALAAYLQDTAAGVPA